jgi:hypothetical protein
MTEVFAIVECKVTYKDGSIEYRRPSFAEVSAGLASVDKVSVAKYLRENLKNVESIELLDTIYFPNKTGFDKYLNSL